MSETEMLEQRMRAFAAASEGAMDWEDVLKRAGQRLPARRLTRRRLVLALTATVVVATSLVVVFVVSWTRGISPRGPAGPLGPGDGATTLARPLPTPSAKQVSLSEAVSALGGPIVLPDSPQATPSEAGAVWINEMHGTQKGDTSTEAAVTFPSQGLIITYMRPPIHDPLANYQNFVQASPGSRVIYLGGVPALAIDPYPAGGSSWGSIEFVVGGTTIDVLGQRRVASLQGIAQSILSQTTG